MTLMLDRRPAGIAIAALMFWGCATPANAQAVAVPALKAAFLYNFAKFAEWPADSLAQGQRLSLCVVNDAAVADALEQAIKGRAIEGHVLTVHVIKAEGPVRSCHVLYITGLDARRSGQLLGVVKGAAILTVSDADRFAESGGVAQLILEQGRMRFAVNVAAARRAHVRLSPRLLRLAMIVKDHPHAPL
jgi:hypothetical protein